MIANGIRVKVKSTSRAHRNVRNLNGTIVGFVGYGDYAVQFDVNIGNNGYIHYGFNPVTNDREPLLNVRYVSQRSLDIITVDVGDEEDDL
jgi:hypothetical protein